MYTDKFFKELVTKEIVFENLPIKTVFRLFEIYIQEQQRPDPLGIERLIHMLDKLDK